MRMTREKPQPDHFAGMRNSRLLRGHVEGFRAARRVWTCRACDYQRYHSPYDADGCSGTHPAACKWCGNQQWAYSASKSEAARYAELRALEKRGWIRDLRHPASPLTIKTLSVHGEPEAAPVPIRIYTADFSYQWRGTSVGDWIDILEDHKPRAELTELAKLIHKFIWYQYGIAVRITYYKGKKLHVLGGKHGKADIPASFR